MADATFSVLDAAAATVTFRAQSVVGTTLVMMSVPSNLAGTAIIGAAAAVASTIPVNVFTTVPSLLTVVSTAGAPAAMAVKASAGTLKNVSLYCNNTTIPIFLKLYNLTTGAVNSSVAPKFTVGVPPGAWRDVPFGDGAAFTTAISYLITGLISTTDTTAVAIDDIHGVITFI